MSMIQILIVDDFLRWQHLARRMLESESNLKIIGTATHGLEAVQKATQFQPEVILMDISLPGMNGFEAARHIRLLSPGSRILFLSENRGADFIEAALQAGGIGYVLKSDANSDLLDGLKSVLRGQQFVSHSLRDGFNLPDQNSQDFT
jgi:two-component system, NarL family, nitrate/nitrite response regulator NarL